MGESGINFLTGTPSSGSTCQWDYRPDLTTLTITLNGSWTSERDEGTCFYTSSGSVSKTWVVTRTGIGLENFILRTTGCAIDFSAEYVAPVGEPGGSNIGVPAGVTFDREGSGCSTLHDTDTDPDVSSIMRYLLADGVEILVPYIELTGDFYCYSDTELALVGLQTRGEGVSVIVPNYVFGDTISGTYNDSGITGGYTWTKTTSIQAVWS